MGIITSINKIPDVEWEHFEPAGARLPLLQSVTAQAGPHRLSSRDAYGLKTINKRIDNTAPYANRIHVIYRYIHSRLII